MSSTTQRVDTWEMDPRHESAFTAAWNLAPV